MIPIVENVVLDLREVEDARPERVQLIWFVGEEIIGPDSKLAGILNEYGKQGFRIISDGGILSTGIGPTRLILARMITPEDSDSPVPAPEPRKKNRTGFFGGDED